MLADLESYLFRRMICSVSSNGLNKLVPSLIVRLDSAEDDLAETFAALLITETAKATRMPTDEQFRQALLGEDLYRPAPRCKYLLAGLENHNHPKDPRSFSEYTIEHIMPQNVMAHAEWCNMLADLDRFPLLVNSLGNLTLTAYNSELSDGTFEQKKNRAIGGYDSEYLSIPRNCMMLRNGTNRRSRSEAPDLPISHCRCGHAPQRGMRLCRLCAIGT